MSLNLLFDVCMYVVMHGSQCSRVADGASRRWFSGRMLACHAGDPGSIPGRRKPFNSANCDIRSTSLNQGHARLRQNTCFDRSEVCLVKST